jgi:hypothetical protein
VNGENDAMSFASFQKNVRRLYEGATTQGVRFRYTLLAFDIVTVLFIIATSFLPSNDVTEALDVLFGVVILADFSARLFVSRIGPTCGLQRHDSDAVHCKACGTVLNIPTKV